MGLFRRLCILSALLSAIGTDCSCSIHHVASSSKSGSNLAAASSPQDSSSSDNNHSNLAVSSASSGEQKGEFPLLPEGDPNSGLPSIKLGEKISFEAMGPVIINVDGTTRRISNWDQLTEREKEVAWRRISKRNEERRKVLLQQLQEPEKRTHNDNGEL